MRLKLFALLLLCSVATWAQEAHVTVDLTKYILNGTVTLRGGDYEMTSTMDESKKVQFDVPMQQAGYYKLTIDFSNHEIYLEPGKSITLATVPDAEGGYEIMNLTLQVSGDLTAINNYLANRRLEQMADSDFLLPEEAYIQKIKQMTASNEKMVRSQKLGKPFTEDEVLRARYETLEPLTRYPIQHYWEGGNETMMVFLAGNTPKVKAYMASELKDDASLWRSKAYRDYVSSAVSMLALRDLHVDWDRTVRERCDTLMKYFKNPTILDGGIQVLALDYVTNTEGDSLKSIRADYDKYVSEANHQALAKAYEKWSHFQKGATMSNADAKYQDIDGKEVSFDQLLGSYVYVDVWATWCGPCRQELPHLKTLEKKFEGRNIQFVSISIDNTRAPWVKMVNDQKMQGIQWWGGPECPILADYKITGIPRFLLIDPEGRIINSDMTRPSEAATEEFFNTLKNL